MNDIRMRLDRELSTAVSDLQQLNAPLAAGTPPLGDQRFFAARFDGSPVAQGRQAGLAARERLLDRVSRLSAAIDRMSEGEYGLCEECGAPIPLARLNVMPEVATCAMCDDGGGRHGL